MDARDCHASFAKSAFENRVVLWMRGRCRALPYPLFGLVMRAKARLVTKATAPKTAMVV